jgi:RNA polymerase sigma factor (sigma-70 family)
MLGRMRVTSADYDDCYEAAIAALIRSAVAFRPELGFKFVTYAGRAIGSSINRARYMRQKQTTREHPSDTHVAVDARRPGDAVMAREALDTLRLGIASLDDRTRGMLELRYWKQCTLDEVGTAYGLTKERARQVLNGALVTLRKAM